MASLYELAIFLKLRNFKIMSVEKTEDALCHNDSLSIEKKLLISSLLIASREINDAKKFISEVESVSNGVPETTRIQVVIRRLRIALFEKNEYRQDYWKS